MHWLEDVFDPWASPEDYPAPTEVTCRYCGKTGLEWAHDGTRWVLTNEAGNLHTCNRRALERNLTNDFEDLTQNDA